MKDRLVLLRHFANFLQCIRDYTTGGQEQFLNGRKTQDAVIRNLEIVGQIVETSVRIIWLATGPKFPGPWLPAHETSLRNSILASPFLSSGISSSVTSRLLKWPQGT